MSHQFYRSLKYMIRCHTFSNISAYLCSDSAMTFYKTVLCYYSLSSSFFYMTSFLFSLFLYPPEENGRVPLKARDYKASNSTKSGVMCVYSSSDYTFSLKMHMNLNGSAAGHCSSVKIIDLFLFSGVTWLQRRIYLGTSIGLI